MKKIIYMEIAVMALVLIVAIAVAAGLSRQTFAPDTPQAEVPSTGQTTSSQETSADVETTLWEPNWKTFPEDRQLLAQQYFVYDCNTQQFVKMSASATERVYPASITKLATALVAMEYLQPDTVIQVDDVLDMVAWGSSVAELQVGDILSVEQLVEAMLLPSGNDAAYVLAAAAGRRIVGNPTMSANTAVSVFMAELNAWTKEVGMTDTYFVNPDGIHDDEHYMTFADLALLGKLAMENETIMRYASVVQQKIEIHEEQVEWKNTNALINPVSEYYCPYAVGLKTGQTPSAGSCLLSAFRMDDKELIIGVFGCPEVDDRFDDTLQLFNEIVLN